MRTLETLPLLERVRLIWQHRGGKHLDAEEWLALEKGGDLNKPFLATDVGYVYAGDRSAIVVGQLRRSRMEAILREKLEARLVAEIIGL